MAKFFIDRPIFAWVIACSSWCWARCPSRKLPVSQYPPVAPPSIVVSAAYPGASAQTLEDSVLAVIEREMNGAPGLAYMEAVARPTAPGRSP
jgi:multidrug efflux pump